MKNKFSDTNIKPTAVNFIGCNGCTGMGVLGPNVCVTSANACKVHQVVSISKMFTSVCDTAWVRHFIINITRYLEVINGSIL